MNLKPANLPEEGYTLLDELNHSEIGSFIKEYLKKRTRSKHLFILINGVLLGLTGIYFIKDFNLPGFDLAERFSYLSYGITLAFTLVPLHEYIHVLAYKWQGAQNTSYAYNLKKFYFMALADRFVANRKEFQFVALAPFVVISSLLTFLFFLLNGPLSLTVLSTLWIHTAMCSGDFGLLSYFDYHKDKSLVTFDDVEKKISYFYAKVQRN